MNNTTCPDCNGTGADANHHYPDGSAAACQTCEGYGDLGPLPTREQFHRFLKKWAEEHGKEFIDIPLRDVPLDDLRGVPTLNP
jgi:hypothetical protein